MADQLDDSQRFQVREAAAVLARWDAERDYAGRLDTERTLADHLRNVLAIVHPGEDPHA